MARRIKIPETAKVEAWIWRDHATGGREDPHDSQPYIEATFGILIRETKLAFFVATEIETTANLHNNKDWRREEPDFTKIYKADLIERIPLGDVLTKAKEEWLVGEDDDVTVSEKGEPSEHPTA